MWLQFSLWLCMHMSRVIKLRSISHKIIHLIWLCIDQYSRVIDENCMLWAWDSVNQHKHVRVSTTCSVTVGHPYSFLSDCCDSQSQRWLCIESPWIPMISKTMILIVFISPYSSHWLKISLNSHIMVFEHYYHVIHPSGAYYSPIAFTLPDGLQSVNGSSRTGGCQPESCVMMPITGTAVNGCDCPGSTPVSGVLIDGVIPSIDAAQCGTWARELFNSMMIFFLEQ